MTKTIRKINTNLQIHYQLFAPADTKPDNIALPTSSSAPVSGNRFIEKPALSVCGRVDPPPPNCHILLATPRRPRRSWWCAPRRIVVLQYRYGKPIGAGPQRKPSERHRLLFTERLLLDMHYLIKTQNRYLRKLLK